MYSRSTHPSASRARGAGFTSSASHCVFFTHTNSSGPSTTRHAPSALPPLKPASMSLSSELVAACAVPAPCAPEGLPHATAPCPLPTSSPSFGRKYTRPEYVRSLRMRQRPYSVSLTPPIQRSVSDSMSTSEMRPHVELSTARRGGLWLIAAAAAAACCLRPCETSMRSAGTVWPRASANAALVGVQPTPAPSSRLIATALPEPPGTTASGTASRARAQWSGRAARPLMTSCRRPSPLTTHTTSSSPPSSPPGPRSTPNARATSKAWPACVVSTRRARTPARASSGATARRYVRSAPPEPLAGLTRTSTDRGRVVGSLAFTSAAQCSASAALPKTTRSGQ
mmetsp:Transcript_7751/g.31506  ORF Transcript_7751/g.31506 Transcript_7751/m.31506 type:complete len:340 (-) Transcript_7751:326-1345(-)